MPDSNLSAVDRSRQAWRTLGSQLASVTPKQAGRLALGIVAVVVSVWVAVASWPALLPFLIGGVIAYTVLPLVNAMDKILPRFVAALIGVLLALAVLAGLTYVIVPPLITQLLRLIDALPNQAQVEATIGQIAADPRFSQLPKVIQVQLLEIVRGSLGRLQPAAEQILPSLLSKNPVLTLVNTFSNILGLIVLPTWALALLKDQPRAWPSLANVVPPGMRRDARAYVRIVDNAFGTFFRGQVVVAFAVGLATYAALALMDQYLGVPIRYKLPLAVIAGFLQLIPEVGPMVNIIGTTILAVLVQGRLAALEILLIYMGIQWLTGKLVADRFSNRLLDIHPVILVLVIVALTQLGPLWFFLAAPIAAVARDLWRYTYGRLREPSFPAGVLPSEREVYQRRVAQQAAARPLPAAYRRR